jgi:ubiquinone/menaquinone biosynthesis C-methylase UbiE
MSDIHNVPAFYLHFVDYWKALSAPGEGEPSRMLNFGYWPTGIHDLHDAQIALLDRIESRFPRNLVADQGLEIGCGIGGISLNLLRRHAALRMTAVDISDSQLAQARANAAEMDVPGRFTTCQGSSMALPLPEDTFDFALCIESSFHYEDKQRFFDEMFRVLRPGSFAIVADITCSDIGPLRFKRNNHFESADTYLRMQVQAGFEPLRQEDIGAQVYRPLREHIARFNARHRSSLGKYWSMVSHNYSELSDTGVMGYHLFSMRKPA